MDFPSLPDPFQNPTELAHIMNDMSKMKKSLTVVNSSKPPVIKKLKFTIKNDFPALLGSELKRKKRIKKKPRKQGKLIKRFDCELINISEKIKEVCEKKSLVIRNTNQRAYIPIANLRKKKLTRIKKVVQAAKKMAEYKQAIAQMDKTIADEAKTPVGQNDSKQICGNLVTLRVKSIFNNSEAVKKSFNSEATIREYVDNILDPEFDGKVLQLINRLTFAYMLKKAQTPLKARKRVVSGFNEVLKTLNFIQKQK